MRTWRSGSRARGISERFGGGSETDPNSNVPTYVEVQIHTTSETKEYRVKPVSLNLNYQFRAPPLSEKPEAGGGGGTTSEE